MEDALSYTDYILGVISHNQLYKSTAFRYTQAWTCLLWMDKVRITTTNQLRSTVSYFVSFLMLLISCNNSGLKGSAAVRYIYTCQRHMFLLWLHVRVFCKLTVFVWQCNYSGIRGYLTESLSKDCSEYAMFDDVELADHMEPEMSLTQEDSQTNMLRVSLSIHRDSNSMPLI